MLFQFSYAISLLSSLGSINIINNLIKCIGSHAILTTIQTFIMNYESIELAYKISGKFTMHNK
jgi:hypothetical protein